MPIFEAFLLLPEFVGLGEAALGVEAALAAGAGAAGLFGAEAAGATLGAEALGTAGAAAAVPEAATGINAITPELYASAVENGYIPAGKNLYDTGVLADIEKFRNSQMANQGSMVANPYAQITASNTSGPITAAGSSVPAPAPVAAGPLPPAAPGGSYVEATGSPDPAYFRSPTPAEPPGFLDKLSDAFSPLQKGFEKAQEFAKKNPLIAGVGLTALSRMASSGDSMPDTTYKGPLSKYKLSKDFKGSQANPADYRYIRSAASGGIMDYKEGGTTEPLTHADMGIAVDNDLDTKYLDPYSAARIRLAKQKRLARVSLPEMQAPTPMGEINVGPRTAAHGGIMQVKRFYEGEGVGVTGPGDAGGPHGGTAADAAASANAAANAAANANYDYGGSSYGSPGSQLNGSMSNSFADTGGAARAGMGFAGTGSGLAGTGVNAAQAGVGGGQTGYSLGNSLSSTIAGLMGRDSEGNARAGTDAGSRGNGFDGGGNGGDLIDNNKVNTTPVKPPVTNIDDLKPQFVNPEMYRPTSDPYAHYAKYDNEDYNYLRTPNMAARSSPFNTKAMAEVLATVNKAKGGDINSYAQGGMSSLGGYARGGMPRLLDGPGDGMSDNIPATINDRQPARLADGEFVVPADVVSHLGNGSTKAGSQRLHLMMDQVRKARTGNPKQGKRINPDKFMPR